MQRGDETTQKISPGAVKRERIHDKGQLEEASYEELDGPRKPVKVGNS